MNTKTTLAVALTTATLLLGTTAYAQTLRMAFIDPIEGLDEVYDPKPETTFTGTAIFNSLLRYVPETQEYEGVLAEEVVQIDDLTWEISLRQGITFHDGEAFNADDVVHTLNFWVDPNANFPSKGRYSFVDHAEKIDDFTVRVHLKSNYAMFLARLATGAPIYPEHAHGTPEQWATFGRNPIGTGPYRAVQVDSDNGVILERFEDYAAGEAPDFERIEIRYIPDPQTQIAELMVGNLDIFSATNRSAIDASAGIPGVNVSVGEDYSYLYMFLDAAGRSGHPALQDIRVRQAIAHAINRDELRVTMSRGGEDSLALDRICFPSQVGCAEGGETFDFDIDAAKALLAEAGYADGFDLTITTNPGPQQVSEAIAGYLRAVGIRASVETETIASFRDKRAAGELEMTVMFWTHGGMPDAGYALSFFFENPATDYSGNPRFQELATLANQAGPDRQTLLTEAYDLMASEAYMLPVSSDPIVFLHSDNVVVDREDRGGLLNTYGVSITNLAVPE